jgi:hypothetical protein
MVLGFSAGSFPGAGLLLVLLSMASASEEMPEPPAVVVNGAAREALFTPLALSALELADPAMVASVAVTLWDSTDEVLREYLVGQADLVLAAGCDEPMAEVRRATERISQYSKPVRFHQRGHRVHLTTIGREGLALDTDEPESGVPLVEVVALLASLDVVLGCQQGCQCSGIQFVEIGDGKRYHSPEAYCQAVIESLRQLNLIMPMDVASAGQGGIVGSAEPEGVEGKQCFATEKERFRVVLEAPTVTPERLRTIFDNSHGGEVFVVPVRDMADIPKEYLSHLGPERLKAISVALGPLDDVDEDGRLPRFVEALGAAGVQSIRTIGRGAFPLGTYPWDGLIPVGLTLERPKGHFATLEFDRCWGEIFETFRQLRRYAGWDGE